MKKILLFLGVVIGSLSVQAQIKMGELETGDLLFQNLDCGEMCDAIEAVTTGWHHLPFSHMAVVEKTDSGVYVWESMGPGVRRVALDSFSARSKHELITARLKAVYQKLIPAAMAFIRKQRGVPYDEAFLYNNGKYYCSELIYDAFKSANQNKPFFRLYPMTFKQPGSDKYFDVWVRYYQQLNMPIPEGKPGCNPGGMSRSEKIKILGPLQASE